MKLVVVIRQTNGEKPTRFIGAEAATNEPLKQGFKIFADAIDDGLTIDEYSEYINQVSEDTWEIYDEYANTPCTYIVQVVEI